MLTTSIGYAGGNVQFGGQQIVGEWSTTKLTSKTTGDSFHSSTSYMSLGIKFDDVRYYEYWSKFYVTSTGAIASDAAWTPLGSYGVTKDGMSLVVDKYSSKKTYTYKKIYTYNGKKCITVTEIETGEEYDLCKVS